MDSLGAVSLDISPPTCKPLGKMLYSYVVDWINGFEKYLYKPKGVSRWCGDLALL